MGFWNGLWKGVKTTFGAVTGSESTYYPDNTKRENRINDLHEQNSILFESSVGLVSSISELLSIFDDDKIIDIFNSFSFDENWKNITSDQLMKEISLNNVHDIFMMQAIGMSSKETRSFDVIDLPLDMKMFQISGIPLYIPVGGVVGGSISGAVKRSKLQSAIKELVKSRKSLLKTKLTLDYYKTEFAKAIPDLEQLSSAGLDVDEVKNSAYKSVKKIASSNYEVSDDNILDAAKRMDADRNSWTKEDE